MSAKRQIRHLFSRMWRLPLVSVLDADTTFFSAFRSRAGVSFKGGLLSSPFDSMAQAMEVHSLRWIMSFPALSWIARPSSRRAALLPSQKRVTSVAFLLRLVWRVSTPGPKGKGAGVQNAGMRARAGGVGFRVASVFPCQCRPNIQEVGCGFFPVLGGSDLSASGLSMVAPCLLRRFCKGGLAQVLATRTCLDEAE